MNNIESQLRRQGHFFRAMVLLQEGESPEQYLKRTEMLMVLQHGMDALLSTCVAKGPNGETIFTREPKAFLSDWLKSNNPARNEEMRKKLDLDKAAISAGAPAAVEKDDLLDDLEAKVTGAS